MPTALITGITGQDGSYLAELLLTGLSAVSGGSFAVHDHLNNNGVIERAKKPF